MTHSDEPQGVFPREDPTDIPLQVSSLTRRDFPPELWALIRPVHDHSAWARSVRWSCGRPLFGPIRPLFDTAHYRQGIAAERMRAYVLLGITRPEPPFVVSVA